MFTCQHAFNYIDIQVIIHLLRNTDFMGTFILAVFQSLLEDDDLLCKILIIIFNIFRRKYL